MAAMILHESIKSLLRETPFLTQTDIVKKIKIDKIRLSGFLDAMVEYGDISVKKIGNSKAYFIEKSDK